MEKSSYLNTIGIDRSTLLKKNTKRALDCWGSTTETVTCRRMNGTYCSMINFDLAQLRKYLFTYSDEVLG